MWRCLPSATLAPGLRWEMCGSLFHRPCCPPFYMLLVCDSRLRPSPSGEEDAALRLRRRKGHQTLEPGKRFSVEKLSVCRWRSGGRRGTAGPRAGGADMAVSLAAAGTLHLTGGRADRDTPLSPDRAPKFNSLLIPPQSPAISRSRPKIRRPALNSTRRTSRSTSRFPRP